MRLLKKFATLKLSSYNAGGALFRQFCQHPLFYYCPSLALPSSRYRSVGQYTAAAEHQKVALRVGIMISKNPDF